MEAVWRLAWALPLVLGIGFVAVLMLRRQRAARAPNVAKPQRMSLQESLALSDDTRLHLIEVDGEAYLLLESVLSAALQPAPWRLGRAARSSPRFGAAWSRGLHKDRPQ